MKSRLNSSANSFKDPVSDSNSSTSSALESVNNSQPQFPSNGLNKSTVTPEAPGTSNVILLSDSHLSPSPSASVSLKFGLVPNSLLLR